MGNGVAEHDIDRLLNTTSATPEGAAPAATPAALDPFANRLDQHRAPGNVPGPINDAVNAASVTLWDVPIFILYACLGIFTRIWTDVTLYFDFNGDSSFRVFAVSVSMVLHGFIIAIIANAWRAKWEFPMRNLLAMATLGGYLGFRLLTQL